MMPFTGCCPSSVGLRERAEPHVEHGVQGRLPGPARHRSETGECGVEGGVVEHRVGGRSEEHTSELQSLMRISYAVFCLKKKKNTRKANTRSTTIRPNTTDDRTPCITHTHINI